MNNMLSFYASLSTIHPEVIEDDKLPLLPNINIDLQAIESSLKYIFKASDLYIDTSPIEWYSEDKLNKLINSSFTKICLSVSSIEGHLYFMINKSALDKLLSWTFTQESLVPFFDDDETTDYTHYLALQILNGLDRTQIFPDRSLLLDEEVSIPKSSSLVTSVNIHINHSMDLPCYVIISKQFQKNWYNAAQKNIQEKKFPAIMTDAGIAVGYTDLDQNEYQSLRLGDVLIPDTLTIDPHSKQGTAIVCAQGYIFAKGSIKENTVFEVD